MALVERRMAAPGAAPRTLMSLTIREIAPADAAAAAQLSAEFGYPVSCETIERRIALFQNLPDHAVFIAHIGGSRGLDRRGHRSPSAIGTLRRNRRLCRCRKLSRQRNRQAADRARRTMDARTRLARALVRSQVSREPAHRFYLRAGYTRVKTSAVFEKRLADH